MSKTWKNGLDKKVDFLRATKGFFGAHFPSKLSKKHTPVSKKRDPGILKSQSHSVDAGRIQSTPATGASQSGVRTASRNHPSSRAGDQDDVSYKQILQKMIYYDLLRFNKIY